MPRAAVALNTSIIGDLSTLVIFKYFLEAFKDSFKVSRFLVFRFLKTQKPPKTAGNRKLNVQIADASRPVVENWVGAGIFSQVFVNPPESARLSR